MIHCVLETFLQLPLPSVQPITTLLSHTLMTNYIFGMFLLQPTPKYKDKINSSEFNAETVHVFEYMD